MSYKAEIKIYDDPKFHPNAVALATHDEADAYGRNNVATWTLAESYRVVESTEPVNYQWSSSAGLVAVNG